MKKTEGGSVPLECGDRQKTGGNIIYEAQEKI